MTLFVGAPQRTLKRSSRRGNTPLTGSDFSSRAVSVRRYPFGKTKTPPGFGSAGSFVEGFGVKENFGVLGVSTLGKVSAIVAINGAEDATEMRKVLEAAMRAGIDTPRVREWRRQVMNLRARAHREDWRGWE